MSLNVVIPLFPLKKVLFPKMIIPLHVFEERYKEIIDECLEKRSNFGVLHGDKVEPGVIGTIAHIHRVLHEYDDGGYDLLVLGRQRFRLHNLIEGRIFLKGRVELFDDLPGDTPPIDQVREMLELYHTFISKLDLSKDQKRDLESLIRGLSVERELSYIIGQTIGLDIQKQIELLAQTTAASRIDRLMKELQFQNGVYRLASEVFKDQGFDPSRN